MTNAFTREPLYFGPVDRPLAGWLHHPATGRRCTLAVVLCNPFGHEAASSHRTFRLLADRLAAAGILALRFDYEGTGNSAGATHELSEPSAWRSSILAAVDLLGEVAPGVPRAMVGLRLGALLALDAAAHSPPLAGLLLIAPPRTGRQFLREIAALHGASGAAQHNEQGAVLQEVFGAPLPAKLRSYIDALDVAGSGRLKVRRVWAIDRSELPGGTRFGESVRTRAPDAEILDLPGIAALLADPHEAQLPTEILDAVVERLARLAAEGDCGSSRVTTGAPAGLGTSVRMPASGSVPALRESLHFLDEERRLFGVLTRAEEAPGRRDRQVMLVSSGANPTPGPNRLYVSLARALATRGMTVLRFDVAGIGDSSPHTGEPDHVVYPARAAADVAAAARFLLAREPAPVVAGGLCSGGYHAFVAAKAGAPLAGLAILNPLTFEYVEGMPLNARPFVSIAEAQRYKSSVRSAAAWRRLVTGRVGLLNVVLVYGRRLAGIARRHVRNALRHSPWPLADDIGHQLEQLAARSVDVLFVFAADDPGPRLLAEFGGPAARRLEREGRIRVITIDGPDHAFTLLRHQATLIEALATSLSREVTPVPAPAARAR